MVDRKIYILANNAKNLVKFFNFRQEQPIYSFSNQFFELSIYVYFRYRRSKMPLFIKYPAGKCCGYAAYFPINDSSFCNCRRPNRNTNGTLLRLHTLKFFQIATWNCALYRKSGGDFWANTEGMRNSLDMPIPVKQIWQNPAFWPFIHKISGRIFRQTSWAGILVC